jgi:hypothetical protein
MSRRLFAVLIVAVMIVTGLQYWRARQIREALYAAFTPVQLTNCTLQRFGETNDGGYLMCGNLLSAAQSGYSYGIGGADAWGCDVATLFDIPIHQYDCFNTTETRCPGNSSRFHAECIGPERVTTDGRPFDTFANHIERNGDAGKRLVVKMDVEGAEWRSLLIAPDHALEAIDQMVIEFHNVEEASFLETAVRLRQFFHVANVHMNNWSCRPGVEPFPADVFEALLVNKRIAVADTSITAPARSGLDAPNMPEYPDCQQSAPVSELQRIARWTYRKVRTAVSLVRRTVVG